MLTGRDDFAYFRINLFFDLENTKVMVSPELIKLTGFLSPLLLISIEYTVPLFICNPHVVVVERNTEFSAVNFTDT